MKSETSKAILFFLDRQSNSGKNPLVRRELIQKKIIGRNWKNEENQSRYLLAIGELIDNHWIDRVDYSYQITEIGKELARKLRPIRNKQISKVLPLILMVPFLFWIGSIVTITHEAQYLQFPLSTFINNDDSPINATLIKDWFDPFPENLTLNGLIDLSPQSPVVETDSQNSFNHYEMTLPVNVKGATRIHLFINLTYLSPEMVIELNKKEMEIGRIWWITPQGKDPEPVRLFADKNIRDWIIGNSETVVTPEDDIRNVWTGLARWTKRPAVIDCLTIEVPERIRQTILTSIIIDDRSWEILANANPGIVIFGVTVEYEPTLPTVTEK